MHYPVSVRGVCFGGDRPSEHVERRINGHRRNLLQALSESSKRLGAAFDATLGLADPDDQGTAVDGKRGQVAGGFLVGGGTGLRLALEVEIMALVEHTVIDRGEHVSFRRQT